MKKVIIILLAVLFVFGCVGKQVKTTTVKGQNYTYESPYDPIEIWNWEVGAYPMQVMHSSFGVGWEVYIYNPDEESEWEFAGIFVKEKDMEKDFAEEEHAFISSVYFYGRDQLRMYFYDYDAAKNSYIFNKEMSTDDRTKT